MNEIIPNNDRNNIYLPFKEVLKIVSTMLGILAILMTALVVVYQFLIYLSDIQLFNYWSIDYSFYSNEGNIMNSLLYSFCTICVLVLFSLLIITVKNKSETNFKKAKSWITIFLIYAVCFSILCLKELFKFKLDFSLIVIHIIGLIISFFMLLYYSKKIEKYYIQFKEKNIIDISFKNVAVDILCLIVAFFVTFILLGLINSIWNKDYQIINSDNNKCNVILYSTRDYYIIADCEKKDEELIVYKDTQRKIDNYNIISKWEKFKSVKKF